jgi:hypothetical protein
VGRYGLVGVQTLPGKLIINTAIDLPRSVKITSLPAFTALEKLAARELIELQLELLMRD